MVNSINKLVTVIIPTHNRQDYIVETLESIIRQTYKAIEVIIIDDHSEDSYYSFLEDYVKRNNTSVELILVKNDGKGACAARNTGIRLSKGSYIQFFDDDDIMLPDHIEKKVDILLKGDYDYVACNYTFFDSEEPNTVIGKKDIATIRHNAPTHLLSKAFPTPCFMCTKKTIDKIKLWNESIKKLQDFSYFHRLFLYGCSGFYMNEYLFKVRTHSNSITQNSLKTKEGQILTYQAIESVRKEWKISGREKWATVKLPLTFLQFTTARNLILYGFLFSGLKSLFVIFYGSPFDFMQIIAKSIVNKTVHLTDILINENS